MACTTPIGARSPLDTKLMARLERLSVAWIPEKPRGREKESVEIHKFLTKCLYTKRGNSLYISGLPGSGKTLTLNQTLTSFLLTNSQASIQTFSLNCASLSTPSQLYQKLITSLKLETTTETSNRNPRNILRSYFTHRQQPLILILDELDYLTSRDQAILYDIFSWPRLPNSKIVVIGIANAVHLPQRLLPWLRKSNSLPIVLPFAPYTANQLADIIRQRLEDKDNYPNKKEREEKKDVTIGDGPIMLIAKRVAAASGDIRKCLDICRMALLKSREKEGNYVDEKKDDGGYCSITAVADVLQVVGGSSSAVHTIQKLPLTQQIVLGIIANKCNGYSDFKKSNVLKQKQLARFSTLHSFPRSVTSQMLTLGQAFEYYNRWCTRARVDGVSWGDFVEIVGVLRNHHLVDVIEGGITKSRSGSGRMKRARVGKRKVGVTRRRLSSAMEMKGWIIGLKCTKEDVQKGCEGKSLLRWLVGTDGSK